MTRIVATVLLLTGVLVMSCQTTSSGPPSDDQGKSKPAASPSPQSTPPSSPIAGTPAQPTDSPSQGETQVANVASKQLAADRGIPIDQIQVVKVEQVEWSDTSLGCPKPGFFYAQVVTPGYRVILSAQGTTYEYHTAGTERAVLCEM
ncbi:MAG: hypothetical protein EPO21_11445 [Chloroflexota bacterium]|nr:MAG: hypothetical protein EPO21_11445 [Chloroflexota bacterium]